MKSYKGFSTLWTLFLLLTVLGALAFIAGNIAQTPYYAELLRTQKAEQAFANFTVGKIAQSRIGQVYVDPLIESLAVPSEVKYTSTTVGTQLPASLFNYDWDMPEYQLKWTNGDYSYTELASFNELALNMKLLPQVSRSLYANTTAIVGDTINGVNFTTLDAESVEMHKKDEAGSGGTYTLTEPEFHDLEITGSASNTFFDRGTGGWAVVYVDISAWDINYRVNFNASALDPAKYNNNHVWYFYGTPSANIAIQVDDGAPILLSPTIGKGEFTPTIDTGNSYLMLGDPANLP